MKTIILLLNLLIFRLCCCQQLSPQDSFTLFSENSKFMFAIRSLEFAELLNSNQISSNDLEVFYNFKILNRLNIKLLNTNLRHPRVFVFSYKLSHFSDSMHRIDSCSLIKDFDSITTSSIPFYCETYQLNRRIIAYNTEFNYFYRLAGFYESELLDFYNSYYYNKKVLNLKRPPLQEIPSKKEIKEMKKVVYIEDLNWEVLSKYNLFIKKKCKIPNRIY